MERHVDHNSRKNMGPNRVLGRHAMHGLDHEIGSFDSSHLNIDAGETKEITPVYEGHKMAAPIDVFVDISANQDRYLERALMKVEDFAAHVRQEGQMDLSGFLLYVQSSAEVDERTANIVFDYMKKTKKLTYRISQGILPAGQ